MSIFRKPQQYKTGVKFLAYGFSGVGKTVFALSFPKIAMLDAELGASFYEGQEEGKNLVAISNTQSYNELNEVLEELLEEHEDLGIETFITDSATKFRENLINSVTEIDIKRAKKKLGSDAELDTATSMRSWGTIGRITKQQQNTKIDLSSKGVNIIDIAQAKEVKDQNQNLIGIIPDMDKKAKFDYDVVLYLFTETNAKGETVFKGRVEKDRTKTYKVGTVIENPSYDSWKESLTGSSSKVLNTDYTGQSDKDTDAYEAEQALQDKTLGERLAEVSRSLDAEGKEQLKADLSKAKITSANDLTKNQQEKLSKILDKYSK